MSKIGVSNVHYALQTTEDTASSPATYGEIKAVPGLVSIEVTPESNTSTLYADNGPYETASSLGAVNVSIDLADLPLDVQADLLGHTYTSGTKTLVKKASDVAPYACLMFEFMLANGDARCVKLYKGKFALPNDSGNTRGENVEFQTSNITASFVQLKNTKEWELVQDITGDTSSFYASVLPTQQAAQNP